MNIRSQTSKMISRLCVLAFRVNEKENGYRGICFLEREIETFALSELNSKIFIFHPIIN